MRKANFIIDLLVLTAAVFIVSWLFRRADPGWFHIQSSAWLMVPLLVGGRHGFSAGVLASVIAALVATLAQHFLVGTSLRVLAGSNPAYYVALLATGVLAGWTQRITSSKNDHLADQVRDLQNEKEKLEAMNRLYRETEAQLQSVLASHRVVCRSLTHEVEAILESGEPVELGLMELLLRQFGLRSAILYRATGSQFNAVCMAGEDRSEFPSHFGSSDAPAIAKEALEKGTLVTCRSFWEQSAVSTEPQEFLAALTGRNPNGHYLLLVRDMRFEFIDWENFALLEAVFQSVLTRARTEPIKRETVSVQSFPPGVKKPVFASR